MAHIILADDDELLCNLIQSKLSAAGPRAQIVTDGQKAFEERQRRTPNAADLARLAGAAIVKNFGYRQLNLLFRLHSMWRYFRMDKGCANVPRIGFTRPDESKADGPLTVERRLGHANPDIAGVKRPPAPAAVDQSGKRSNHR